MLTFRNPEDKTSCIVLNLLKMENQRSGAARKERVTVVKPSPPRAFPMIWVRRNGIEYDSSTLFCPGRPPLTPHFPYLFYTSLSTWFFCVSLCLFPGTGAPTVRLSTSPSSLL